MRQTVAGIARVPPVARERGGFSPPAQDGIHKSARTAQTTAHPYGGRPTKAAMTRTPLLFAVISLALLATEIPAGAAVRLDRAERAAIRHINNFRAAHGRPPVYPARSLNRSAEAHSTDMARRNFFAHTSSDGTPFDVRIRRYIGRGAVGETLAWHTRTRRIARVIVRMWINSPPHRAILLEGNFRRVGLARRHGMWTADFASRR